MGAGGTCLSERKPCRNGIRKPHAPHIQPKDTRRAPATRSPQSSLSARCASSRRPHHVTANREYSRWKFQHSEVVGHAPDTVSSAPDGGGAHATRRAMIAAVAAAALVLPATAAQADIGSINPTSGPVGTTVVVSGNCPIGNEPHRAYATVGRGTHTYSSGPDPVLDWLSFGIGTTGAPVFPFMPDGAFFHSCHGAG